MRKMLIGAAAASAALAAVAATVPADATGGPSASAPQPTYKTVASGLHNPRQISIRSDGVMFVAEAGSGGDGTCIRRRVAVVETLRSADPEA